MLFLLPFKRYLQFSGRSGRAEYWQYVALIAAIGCVLFVFDLTRMNNGEASTPTASLLWQLATLCPTYAVTMRRLHDRDRSGWFIGVIWILNGVAYVTGRMRQGIESSIIAAPITLIYAIVIVGMLALSIYLLVQMCLPGDAAANRYGPPPQANDEVEAADLKATIEAMKERAKEYAPPPPRSAPVDDPIKKLERLAKLHREGVLSDAEFEAQKAALLQRGQL